MELKLATHITRDMQDIILLIVPYGIETSGMIP